MGKIIVDFSNSMIGKPRVFIERRVDEHEIQKLNFSHDRDSCLSTETGLNISLFGRDEDGSIIEVSIPISVEELKNALDEYLDKNKR